MRKLTAVFVTVVLLIGVAAPAAAAVNNGSRASLGRTLLIWIQSRISPPWPAPQPEPAPATADSKRTTS